MIRSSTAVGDAGFALGDPLVDRYLEFVAGRSRPNTLLAVAFDLKTFFTVIAKDPVEVVAADVFEFLAHQRGDRTVIRLRDGESGLSARTIARRLSSVSGFYAYVVARGDTPVRTNPVPRGLLTRRRGGRSRSVPLVRVPHTLPKILEPAEVRALLSALRTELPRRRRGEIRTRSVDRRQPFPPRRRAHQTPTRMAMTRPSRRPERD